MKPQPSPRILANRRPVRLDWVGNALEWTLRASSGYFSKRYFSFFIILYLLKSKP